MSNSPHSDDARTAAPIGASWQEGTRRDFLHQMGVGGALVGAGLLLDACGGSQPTPSSTPTGAIKRGGTLRVGCTGGAGTDTLDPQIALTNPDGLRACMLYDSLATYDGNAQPVLQLAEEITPNRDGTVWTIRLRPGIEFHNGKTATSEDVLFTFKRTRATKASNNYTAQQFMDFTSPNTRLIDSRTLSIGCHAPTATFLEAIVWVLGSGVLPTDFDPKKPVGTGPWRFANWAPGVQSTFTRFENYWQTGVPYMDAVHLVEFADDTSQVNALQSGAVDALAYCEATTIKELQAAGFKTLTSPGGYWNPITMRVDQPPFNDVRVRQAFRLMVDRPALNQRVYEGLGKLGNDLNATSDADFPQTIPQRVQDIAKAKFLLKQAGAENLTVTLVTSNIAAGTVPTATVFAQQASAAGVTVKIQQLPPTAFFSPPYLNRSFSQDVWSYWSFWPQIAVAQVPGAPFNETHWDDPKFNALYREGNGTLDDTRRREIAHELCTINYETGGYIIPVILPNLSAYGSHVHGLPSVAKTGVAFQQANFNRAWVST